MALVFNSRVVAVRIFDDVALPPTMLIVATPFVIVILLNLAE